jgi:hypothetical protein
MPAEPANQSVVEHYSLELSINNSWLCLVGILILSVCFRRDEEIEHFNLQRQNKCEHPSILY